MPAFLAAAIPAIASLAAGFFSAKGQADANKANRDIAREQMDFQERMSNSSAQRSAEDYRRAGLNPALAYERGASTPGGASTTVSNQLGGIVSSALSARAAIQDLKQSREMHLANLDLARENKEKTRADAALANEQRLAVREQGILTGQQRANNLILQPLDNERRALENLLLRYQLPNAKNDAAWAEMLGKTRPGIATAKTVGEILRLFRR